MAIKRVTKPKDTNHTCHAVNCRTNVKPEMLMCSKHWFMVSKSTRDLVWKYYRPGQCDDWRPSAAYCDAAKSAVLEVAAKEGIAIASDQSEVTLYDFFSPKSGAV